MEPRALFIFFTGAFFGAIIETALLALIAKAGSSRRKDDEK